MTNMNRPISLAALTVLELTPPEMVTAGPIKDVYCAVIATEHLSICQVRRCGLQELRRGSRTDDRSR